MIKNTAQFAKDILFESDLNVIIGSTGSGKTELCNFLYKTSIDEGDNSINLEDIHLTNASEEIYKILDTIATNNSTIFLDDSILTCMGKDKDNMYKVLLYIKECCLVNNCSIFITKGTIKEIPANHLSDWINKEPSTDNLLLQRLADNIMVIHSINEKNQPWLLKFFKWIFKFKMPNAYIKFIKSRNFENNVTLYLYYDTKEKKYYDIDRRNPFIRLFYDI